MDTLLWAALIVVVYISGVVACFWTMTHLDKTDDEIGCALVSAILTSWLGWMMVVFFEMLFFFSENEGWKRFARKLARR